MTAPKFAGEPVPAHISEPPAGITVEQAQGIYWHARRSREETDLGNAERIVIDHRHTLRHAHGVGWLAWDGARWQRDTDGEAARRAKDTIRRIATEASQLREGADPGPDDTHQTVDKRATRRFAHYSRSQQRNRLEAALALAATEPELSISADQLDADPFTLNVANGTIDLRTGAIGPHTPDHLLTRICPAAYDPDATSHRWTRFLHDLTGGDQATISYLQRAVGYTLTGDTGAECLFFAHGPAATGKTTFLEAIKAALGDYSATAAFQTLTMRRGHGPSGDLARLVGVRMVACSEVGRGAAFNAEIVKTLTGGDTIVAAFKYRDEFEYKPQFKLWLAANDRPTLDSDDDALRRRIRLIPFTQVVPEDHRDPKLKRALTNDRTELAAIIAWAVEGCLAWQRDGLREPETVTTATDAYFADNDPLADWLEDCCTLDLNGKATRADVRRSYEHHCRLHGTDPISPHDLARALRARGIRDGKSNGHRIWHGIRTLPLRVTGTPRDTPSQNSSHTRPREANFSNQLPLNDPVTLPGDAA